jgi:hypothetical protein
VCSEKSPKNNNRPQTVWNSLAELASHPVLYFVVNWNWKSALLSSIIRGLIFLLATIRRDTAEISLAVIVEMIFSALVAGIYGAFTQVMRFATPEWISKLIFAVFLPAVLFYLDYLVHIYTGMRHMTLSLIFSASFSALSSLFNLYVMRHGALLVGEEGESLSRDVGRMPRLVAGFVAAAPLWIWRRSASAVRRRWLKIVT